jgi:iron complex outermembrane receptor protein
MLNQIIKDKKYSHPFIRTTLAIIVASHIQTAWADEYDAQKKEKVEKIIITGSHIKSSNFEDKSPVQVIDADAIKASGAANLIDVVRDLPVNMGSELVNDGGSLTGTNQFNLRGLGLSSTLTLINGRRAGTSTVADGAGYSFFDVNSLPLNAVSRMDILTDGASATYGSEAVAGVVNIVTRKGFEGIEFTAERNSSVNDSTTLGFALGAVSDKGRFGLYATKYKQTAALRTDFDFIVERLQVNDPLNNAFVSSTGSPGTYYIADVDNSNGYTASVTQRDGAQSAPDADCDLVGINRNDGLCRLDFSEQRGELPAEERLQLFAEGDYEINDKITFFAEGSFSRNHISALQEGSKNHNEGVVDGNKYIPSDHPFNFWVEDPNDNTALVYHGPSISSIGATPVWNGTDLTDWQNGTLVAADLSARMRPLGHHDGYPGTFMPVTTEHVFVRAVVGLDVDITDEWHMNVSYMHSINTRTKNKPWNWIAENYDGINPNNPSAIGSGVWNPFGTRITAPNLISPKDGVSDANNTFTDLQLFMVEETEIGRTEQKVYDLLFTGDAFELPNGEMIAVAMGGQYRTDILDQRDDAIRTLDLDGSDGIVPDIDVELSTASVFAEALVPFSDNLELQLALRHENFKSSGDTTDPKVAIRWQPFDSLGFRASWGTSFQNPTVRQQGKTIGNRNTVDLCSNGTTFFTSHTIEGDDNLKPQSSENINLGIMFESENNISISVDLWQFDYTDLIIGGASAQALADDNFNNDNCKATESVTRDGSGQLVGTNTASSNAGSVVTRGIDLMLRYNIDLDNLGDLDLSSNISYVNTFNVEQADGTFVEAAGSLNDDISSFRPIPQLRGNFIAAWTLNNHAAIATLRYINSYDNDQYGGTIDAHTTLDLQYNLTLDAIFDDTDMTLSLGAINVLDEEPPVYGGRPGYDRYMHDPRGRQLYGKFSVTF